MLVRRLSPWRSDGVRHGVGALCEMDDDLAAVHIAHGSAEAVVIATQPADPPVEAALAPALEGPPAPAAPRKRRH